MRRRILQVLIILLVSMFLRIYPTIISNLPFSTDSWPLIRNAEKLIKSSPTPLSSELFDGYNNYWPLSQVFGSIISIILGVTPANALRIYIPLTAAFSPLILYILLRRVTKSGLIGFLAGVLFASGGPHATFTAGVTKETFANLFFFQSIYIFSALGSGLMEIITFSIVMVALTMSHHMAYLVGIVILSNIFIAQVFLPRICSDSLNRRLGMLLAAALIGLIYYLVYALPGLKVTLSFSDWLSAFSFQVLAFLAMFYVIARPKPRKLPRSWIAMVLAMMVALFINQVTPILPASPHLTPIALFYAYLLIVMGLFAVIGVYSVKERRLDEKIYPVLLWLSSTLGLEGYAIFGVNPSLSLTLAYRIPNFIIPALSTLTTIGILRLSSVGKTQKILALLGFTLLAVALASESYSATILQENYLGYQWLYLPDEYRAAIWINHHHHDQPVYGDLKIKYLLEEYMGLRVDSGGGYSFLAGERKPGSEAILVTYKTMEKNGYVLGPYGAELPANWSKNLYRINKVFSTLNSSIFQL